MELGSEVPKRHFFIGVHVGAGYHSPAKESAYVEVMNEACRTACKVLEMGGSALEATKLAISILEDSNLTNAGILMLSCLHPITIFRNWLQLERTRRSRM
jgi:hypothetical protein